jgi:hypothetical protein
MVVAVVAVLIPQHRLAVQVAAVILALHQRALALREQQTQAAAVAQVQAVAQMVVMVLLAVLALLLFLTSCLEVRSLNFYLPQHGQHLLASLLLTTLWWLVGVVAAVNVAAVVVRVVLELAQAFQ